MTTKLPWGEAHERVEGWWEVESHSGTFVLGFQAGERGGSALPWKHPGTEGKQCDLLLVGSGA